MSGNSKLDLVLLWHMHQPDFRDHATGEYAQPWVYLHAIKDYSDMAAHLENHPKVDKSRIYISGVSQGGGLTTAAALK